MADIVNLNKFRKKRERETARETADQNRARFGRSKTERTKTAADTGKAAKELDGKQLD